MVRKVVWTVSAFEDLESVFNFLRRDSPLYARRLVLDMLAAAETLSEFSLRGRNIPELRESDYREIFVDQYRLIYKVSSNTVHIAAIVHMSRDLPALLEKR